MWTHEKRLPVVAIGMPIPRSGTASGSELP